MPTTHRQHSLDHVQGTDAVRVCAAGVVVTAEDVWPLVLHFYLHSPQLSVIHLRLRPPVTVEVVGNAVTQQEHAFRVELGSAVQSGPVRYLHLLRELQDGQVVRMCNWVVVGMHAHVLNKRNVQLPLAFGS